MVNKKIGYLYAHYRHDKLDAFGNPQIFYIGISSVNDDNYGRSRHKHGRNIIWKQIIKKCKKYDVKILYDNILWDELCEKEVELINKYGRIFNNTGILANINDGGDGADCKPVIQYTLNGEIVRNFKSNSTVELYGFDKSNVSACCNGRIKSHGGFVFRFDGHPFNLYNIIHENSGKPKKKVIQYNLNGEVVDTFDSIASVTNYGFSRMCVSMCCNGKIKSHKGFIFRFENDCFNFCDIKHKEQKKKHVLQFTKDGYFVKSFISISSVEEDNFCRRGVSACCNGKRKYHKGYIFKFSERS